MDIKQMLRDGDGVAKSVVKAQYAEKQARRIKQKLKQYSMEMENEYEYDEV